MNTQEYQYRLALIRTSRDTQRQLFDAGHIDDGLIVGDQIMNALVELMHDMHEDRILTLERDVAALKAARHPPPD